MTQSALKRGDYGLILAFCLVLYTLVLMVGGPLTMHEGVLSQTSRQMAADHDWVIPHFGPAPWLERPPLPQWLTVTIAAVVGHCDQEWIIRIGPALSGTITVLLTGWLGGMLLGRAIGILGALILATMYQFVRYSTLAEADMVLCPIVAACVCVFAYLERLRPRDPAESINPFGLRPWPLVTFFVLLGMTNLAKGLVFGTVMTLAPIGGYLLWNFDVRRILRYVWVWGALVFLGVAIAWPLLVYRQYDDVLTLWRFDLFERLTGNYLEEPRWYYLAHWFWVVAPWSAAGIVGLWLTARSAFCETDSPMRLVWCWAVLTPLVFSFAHGKHHHYMIHFLAPWGILSAVAVRKVWETVPTWPIWLKRPLVAPCVLAMAGFPAYVAGLRLPGPTWITPVVLVAAPIVIAGLWWFATHPQGKVALAGGFASLLVLYWLGFSYKSAYLHRSNDDTAFLRAARDMVPDGQRLMVHAADEALEGLRILFYCPEDTILLHNMTFLHGDNITSPSAYVIARAKEMPTLAKYGRPEILLRSRESRRETSVEDRWALFHVQLRDDLPHRPAHVRFTPMQAMYREQGPTLK